MSDSCSFILADLLRGRRWDRTVPGAAREHSAAGAAAPQVSHLHEAGRWGEVPGQCPRGTASFAFHCRLVALSSLPCRPGHKIETAATGTSPGHWPDSAPCPAAGTPPDWEEPVGPV